MLQTLVLKKQGSVSSLQLHMRSLQVRATVI